MNAIAILLLRILAPASGMLLGLLGFVTLKTNLLGWLLFVAGVVYAAGTVIVAFVRRRNFWESQLTGVVPHAEADDRSFWLISAALAIGLFVSPLEFLYLSLYNPSTQWLEIAGACIAALGGALCIWARRSRFGWCARHLTSGARPLRWSGAYRIIRHPAYAGYILACMGLAIGYASIGGTIALLVLLIPALVWRIRIDERLRSARFGDQYARYAQKTRLLIPGLW